MHTARDKPEGPWYRNHEFWTTLALRYLDAARGVTAEDTASGELWSYMGQSVARTIFESNRIEGAGLPLGATKRIVDALPSGGMGILCALQIGLKPDDFRRPEHIQRMLQHHLAAAGQLDVVPTIGGAPVQPDLIEVTRVFEYSGRRREAREVVQHSKAIDTAIQAMLAWWDAGSSELLTEGLVKQLHRTLADGLMPDDAGVEAGEYRTDVRTVHGAKHLATPAPGLVPACMASYIRRAQAAHEEGSRSPERRLWAAASISYGLVRIHPFPDFNGRVSRLLMLLVLWTYGLPFLVSFAGDSTNRKRYFSSLNRANAGDLKPYEALIGKCLVEAFWQIEDNLALAGLPPLLEGA